MLDETNTLTAQFNRTNDKAQLQIDEGAEEIESDPIFAGTFVLNAEFHEQALVWEKQI